MGVQGCVCASANTKKMLVIPVKMVNLLSNAIVRLFLKNEPAQSDNYPLMAPYRRQRGPKGVGERQNMMVRLLDLEQVSVNDIMIPRGKSKQ